MNEPKPYFLFTRTPLHIGAGQSVGYVDLPIQREPHTRIPIVPGSSLKGVLRDREEFNSTDKEWLFGHENGEADQSKFRAGALLIGEARVLCFPVRSAKGSFAWITSPLALARYERDAKPKAIDGQNLSGDNLKSLSETPKNETVEIVAGSEVTMEGDKVVLEEYTYTAVTDKALVDTLTNWENHFKDLAGLKNDPVWKLLHGRLIIVPDGIFSFYVQSGCEIAQHVAIIDETGTAKDKALFNQENCPAETLFYGVMSAQKINGKPAEGENGALNKLAGLNGKPLQVGGGETTGLGWCSFIFNPGN